MQAVDKLGSKTNKQRIYKLEAASSSCQKKCILAIWRESHYQFAPSYWSDRSETSFRRSVAAWQF